MINNKISDYVNRAQLAINDWQCSGEIYYLAQAKAELADEELAQLDLTRYDAAVAKMMALMGMD